MNSQPRFILASGSPRRRQLLERLGIPFSVVDNPWTEIARPAEIARHQVRRLAREKLQHFLERHPETTLPVLTADTLIDFRGRPLGKPESGAQAWAMYRCLAGKTHRVLTSYCLWLPQRRSLIQKTCSTKVQFIRWDQAVYRDYWATDEWQDAAGGYKIQGAGERLIRSIHGSWTNVMGLPIAEIYGILRNNLHEDLS